MAELVTLGMSCLNAQRFLARTGEMLYCMEQIYDVELVRQCLHKCFPRKVYPEYVYSSFCTYFLKLNKQIYLNIPIKESLTKYLQANRGSEGHERRGVSVFFTICFVD